ncbi:MAG: CpXC domain-containing protein [Lentisphaeraceae bacterium]|nr:CpXC domain-containing protein [Lentisphaeraceae bacterium]
MQEDHKLSSVECPNCGFDIEAEITTTIRPDDQSLNELFNGELNNLICHQCAQEFLFDSPLVFKNEDDSFIIYYNPEIPAEEWKAAEEQMQKALSLTLETLDPEDRPECRLTLTRNEFVEKIALSLADLDDKLIEYLKFHIYKQDATIDQQLHTLLYDFSRSDKDILEFSIMDNAKGKVLQNTQTPASALDQMRMQLEADDCPIDIDELFDGLYVQVKKLFQL